jgi:hypothetical protein
LGRHDETEIEKRSGWCGTDSRPLLSPALM